MDEVKNTENSESTYKERVLPYSMEAEQSVLGAIIMDNQAMTNVCDFLKAEDFFIDANRYIYESMLQLTEDGSPIDVVTMNNVLENRGLMDAFGGISYLSQLATITPKSENIGEYARIMKDASNRRRLIGICGQLRDLSFDRDYDLERILAMAEREVSEMSYKSTTSDFKDIKDIAMEAYEDLEQQYANEKDYTGLSTGFRDLDRRINGLQKTDLVLLAARPAMGKTALALNMVENATIKEGASVAVFSMEMSSLQIVQRMLSSISGVDMSKLKNGFLTSEDWLEVTKALTQISKLKLYIDDTPGIKISQLRNKAKRLKMQRGLDAIFIDYLQLMEGDSKTENRQQEISTISRALKKLAKELECPVVALSQLSRRTESRAGDHRPQLSDLRESGAIEQDADVVMFLYREHYYTKEIEKKRLGEVIVSKNRHGETGTVEIVWFGEIQKFVDKKKDI